MAFSKIASVGASSSNSGASVTTAAIDTSGANLLVAHVADYQSATTGVLTDSKGNTWTGLTPVIPGSARSTLYYCLTPSVGSGHTFAVTKVGADCYPSVQVIAFSGALAYDQEANAAGVAVSTKQPGSLTPPSEGALFVTGISWETSTTMSIDLGFTKEVDNNYSAGNAFGGAIAYFIQGAAAGLNPAWSWSGALDVGVNMATFTATVGGPRFILGTH